MKRLLLVSLLVSTSAFAQLVLVGGGDTSIVTSDTLTAAPAPSADPIYTSPNLVTSNGWSGIGAYAPSPGDCCSNPAGSLPLYDTATNTIRFSYGQATVKQTWAVNQALSNVGAGVQITGYNWGYDLRNTNGGSTQSGVDSLVVWTWLTDSAGATITNNGVTYNTRFDWTRFSGTQNLNNAMAINDVGSLGISFAGKDGGFWAGLYGPEIRNVNMSLNYKFDVCSADPLSSPSCPNYAAAYLNLQCSGNPLYSPQCPGYAQAYFTQQCTINALFDPSCPGYAGAYLNYQCSINPLYSTTCPGYDQAYHDQQCSANPLYATDCRGYDKAYAMANVISTEPVSTTVETTTEPTTTVAVVSDPVVNSTITTTATSVSPAALPTVPLVTTPAVEATTNATSSSVSTPVTTAAPEETNKAPATKREQLAAQRKEAAKREAVAKASNLANDMGKAADMESQKQVQNVVIAAMGYTPGFDAYGKAFVPDAVGYKPFTVYNNQKNVDNLILGRRMYGPSDRIHELMVQSQYKGN